MLVSQVLERAREEVYEAGGVARPAFDIQEGAITDTGDTLTLEGRQTYVPPDGLIEWEDASMEVAEVKSAAGVVVTLQTRGYLGSTPAAHTDGTKVNLDPPYPRYVLFNGLKAVLSQLRRFGLYAKAYTDTLNYSEVSPVALPTGAYDVVEVYVKNGVNWFPLSRGKHFHVLKNFGPTLTSPPSIQFFGAGYQGADLRIVYKTDFGTITTLTDDLDTALVPDGLQQGLALGLTGHILMGRDVAHLESEHIQPDPQNPIPPGTRSSVGRMLWDNFVTQFVLTERVRNMEETPPKIVHGF